MPAERINLGHRALLDSRLKAAGALLSDYSFANLYLFREAHDHRVLVEGSDVFITGRTYDGCRYVMPTADIRQGAVGPLLAAVPEGGVIFPLPEEWLGALKEHAAGTEFFDGDSDYIYTVESLSTYRGQKLHGKKNLLNQFLALYSSKALPLTQERMDDARAILQGWQEDTGEEAASTDYAPCREALELYDELVLCGGIYYVGDEPAGFIIGEELGRNMFVLHFAKGRRKFKGLYQYMFNHFARIMPKQYDLFNFEQDLGKQSLKIAKSSYDPDRMLHKYRVRVGARR
ncbi:MAG: DUF2156 domain-containing protein [Candidatus Omnitrophica bacterium]|nr:DUF2156 domain-containing protein [Candidatus Omnitrophota bacterium]